MIFFWDFPGCFLSACFFLGRGGRYWYIFFDFKAAVGYSSGGEGFGFLVCFKDFQSLPGIYLLSGFLFSIGLFWQLLLVFSSWATPCDGPAEGLDCSWAGPGRLQKELWKALDGP